MADDENKDVSVDIQTIDSGVEGVSADSTFRGCPVFNVSSEEFFSNMRLDRNRMRFKNNSKASQFMKGSRYRKPFYIAYKDKNGEQFLNKIK